MSKADCILSTACVFVTTHRHYALASTDSSVAQSLQLFTARSSSELAQQLQRVRDGAAAAYSMWHTVEAATAISSGIKSSASLTSMISSTQSQQQQQQRAPADYFRLGLLEDAAVRLLELVPQ
jgi:DNA-binding LytR/AlgR family response regulator